LERESKRASKRSDSAVSMLRLRERKREIERSPYWNSIEIESELIEGLWTVGQDRWFFALNHKLLNKLF